MAARAAGWPAIHLYRPASGSRPSRCCPLCNRGRRLSAAATLILFHAQTAAPYSDARCAWFLSGLVEFVVVTLLLVGAQGVGRERWSARPYGPSMFLHHDSEDRPLALV